MTMDGAPEDGKTCEQWAWKENMVETLQGEEVSLVDIITKFERKLILEFAHQYTDFVSHPNEFDPNELQSTSEALNTLLQKKASLLQKDIEDFFVRPTLDDIRETVNDNRKVSYAQVGRSTISTLNGVPTSLNTTSYNVGFENRQDSTFQDLLTALGTALSINDADITSIGSLTVPQILRTVIELSNQEDEGDTGFAVNTGTNLTFTPGISRSLGAAEINIRLQITDPAISPTEQGNNVPSVSRIGTQTLVTTVYTQALDFFDLSTFTSQASVDGGRYVVPIIGQVWNAIFDPIPILGNLFSVDRGNQTVLNESLLLTTAFITPTSLSLGTLYPPTQPSLETFCQRRDALHIYLKNELQLADGEEPRRALNDEKRTCETSQT